MSIIFAGAAPYEFLNVNSLVTTGDGVAFDSEYTEGAIAKSGLGNFAVARFYKETTEQEVWAHGKINFGSNLPSSGQNDNWVCVFTDANGGFIAGVRASWGSLEIVSASVEYVVTGMLPRNTLHDIDIHLFQSGSTRICELYVNGSLLAAARATAAWTVPRNLYMGGNGDSATYYSEIIVTEGNVPTVGMRLHTKKPNPSLPGLNTFEAGYWGSLANASLTEGVVTSEDGARITGGFDPYTGPASPLGIRGIVQSGRFLKNGTLLGLRGQLRIDDVNYDTPDYEYQSDNRLLSIWEKNPATDAKFQVSDFAGMQGGFYTVIDA